MRIIIKLAWIISIVINLNLLRAEDNRLTLTLTVIDESVRIELGNAGFKPMLVNKRFSIGFPDWRSEVELVVKDQTGKLKDVVVKIRTSLAAESDLCWLSPGQFAGRVYEVSYIGRLFGLEPGNYAIRAIYSNKNTLLDKCFTGVLRSNEVTILVK